jgi:PAS domain S-box-containing protein
MPVNILVVDDTPANRVALKSILAVPGYRIVDVGSGEDALRLLLHEDFAVLLIDVVMPGMSGFDLAAAVKTREKTATVPIIFLSAEATDLEYIYKGYGAGAVDYLVKPLVPAMVRAKVSVFVELYRQRRQIELQAKRLVDAERIESRQRLLELEMASQHRYKALADMVPNIVFNARPDGTIDYVNARWFEFTGEKGKRPTSWLDVVAPEDVDRCREGWEAALRFGQPYEGEGRLRRGSDGSYRWHLCRAIPQRAVPGGVVSWLGTFTDIEDLKRAHRELEEFKIARDVLYKEALEAIHARDEFISIASHELKTPLQTIQLQIELLARTSPSPSSHRGAWRTSPEAKLDVLSRQVDRLSRLVAELLDVSRITAGRFTLEPEDVELAAIAREAIARLAPQAVRSGSPIALIADEPVSGTWDPLRVDQIVTNLLTNALKFGGAKPIEVRISNTKNGARLVVRDQGIGIEAKDVERVFQRFERAVSARTYGGLGLGLYIVRRIVEAHGGTIRAESELGLGSIFTVELPREQGNGARTSGAEMRKET